MGCFEYFRSHKCSVVKKVNICFTSLTNFMNDRNNNIYLTL